MNDPAASVPNDLLLRALRGEDVPRPPVWMMRQAGRYLPQYREIAARYDFFTRVQTPELACAITLQPVDLIGVDAAILFSDILVVLQALGLEVQLIESKGPVLPDPIRTPDRRLPLPDMLQALDYVLAAIRLTRQELHNRVPLIGFAGAPWTLFCYLIEGGGSKDFARPKRFAYEHPAAAHALLQTLTLATIQYLNAQIEAGAQAVQVFESWGGALGPDDFAEFALPYLLHIAREVTGAPLIVFPRGASHAFAALAAEPKVAALGLDWSVDLRGLRQALPRPVTLQGNLDPTVLLAPPEFIRSRSERMFEALGCHRTIINLGHGMTPEIPPAHARAFVDCVKAHPWKAS
jgi:uroporphyrinogen decarboxylase